MLEVLATDSYAVSVVYMANRLLLLQEIPVHTASAVVRMQPRQH